MIEEDTQQIWTYKEVVEGIEDVLDPDPTFILNTMMATSLKFATDKNGVNIGEAIITKLNDLINSEFMFWNISYGNPETWKHCVVSFITTQCDTFKYSYEMVSRHKGYDLLGAWNKTVGHNAGTSEDNVFGYPLTGTTGHRTGSQTGGNTGDSTFDSSSGDNTLVMINEYLDANRNLDREFLNKLKDELFWFAM
jgi:hypothetical protein